MVEFISRGVIKLDRILSELDKFVLDFVKILEKHTDYVIISGYVSILLGRSRATEDVDIFIKEMDRKRLGLFYKELKSRGYWCLNSGNIDEIYSYLEDGLAVRFSLKKQTIPNFEVKFAKKRLNSDSLKDFIVVVTKGGRIKISSLERQIAFKRYYLKSDKDLEDAKHIEELFKENLDKDKIRHYKNLIENGMA